MPREGPSYYSRTEVRDGYGPWMIVQPRRRRNMGNTWRSEAPIPYGNNSFTRRHRSTDRQDRGYGRRCSNSAMRGREPIRRMWAWKNSVEGQQANRGSNRAHTNEGIQIMGQSQSGGGRSGVVTTEVVDASTREYQFDDPTILH
ncbi:hypothetical protein HPP92_013222 [Vanilla planifolia]|nr:hypothetical protein HPP92_013222 [Vanilla planifolia]